MMLLDTIATVILAAMMLIPLINMLVGVIVGAVVAGVWGAVAGLAVAHFITVAENWLFERVSLSSYLVAERRDPTSHSPATASAPLC
jgi:hypothetical protein